MKKNVGSLCGVCSKELVAPALLPLEGRVYRGLKFDYMTRGGSITATLLINWKGKKMVPFPLHAGGEERRGGGLISIDCGGGRLKKKRSGTLMCRGGGEKGDLLPQSQPPPDPRETGICGKAGSPPQLAFALEKGEVASFLCIPRFTQGGKGLV